MNIDKIPEKFKDSVLYKKIIEGKLDKVDFIENECFDEIVNNYNDIERILNVYKHWIVNENIYFDLVYNNKKIIFKNLGKFCVFIENFYLSYNFITLLKSLESIYDNVIISNNLVLVDYLFERKLINENFPNYLVKNISIINYVKIKHKYEIEPKKIFDYGILTKNLKFLDYFYNNYMCYLVDKENIIKLIYYCYKNKMNDWINFLIKKAILIDYKKTVYLSLITKNHEIFFNIINNKNNNIKTDYDIAYLFICANYSPEILTWLLENKMKLNNKINSKILFKLNHTYNIISNENFGDNNFLNKKFSDLTLGKLLQLNSMVKNNVILAEWLINNNIYKTTEYLNFAAYWWDTNNFIWLHKKGFEFNNKTIEKIIRCGSVDKLKYLIECNYQFKVNYNLCDLAYSFNHNKILAYLTAYKLNKIDNRYIIKSVIDNNYEMFKELYKNYPNINEHVFSDKNSKINNNRLSEFISNYIFIHNKEHNERKKQRIH